MNRKDFEAVARIIREFSPDIRERMTPRFAIGTTFQTAGKHPRLQTVTDILRTYNSANELVRIRYVAQYEFMGQTVTDHDVCETSIARRLVAAA